MSAAGRTLLGFDFGEKRIGVAVGQTLLGTASALAVIRARNGVPDWEAIDALVSTWAPDELVVGLPLNMDGTEQPMTSRARRFGNRLRERYRKDVHFCDERLSTREARARPAVRRRGSRDTAHDAVAAKIILEGWMTGAVADG